MYTIERLGVWDNFSLFDTDIFNHISCIVVQIKSSLGLQNYISLWSIMARKRDHFYHLIQYGYGNSDQFTIVPNMTTKS